MNHRRLAAGLGVAAVAAAGTTAAVAASAPSHVTINAVHSASVKINRYVQDGTRWQKDVYSVKSGGTVKIVNLAQQDGPHTFTVVNPKDLPKTAKQMNSCKICQKLGQAHGVDPSGNGPPKYNFLENGVGQNTPPNVDQPGDSAGIAPVKKASVTLKITAKKGKTLTFMCLIHPWMQAKVLVK